MSSPQKTIKRFAPHQRSAHNESWKWRWVLFTLLAVALGAAGLAWLVEESWGWSVVVGGILGLAFGVSSSGNLVMALSVAAVHTGLGMLQLVLGYVLRVVLVVTAVAVGFNAGLDAAVMGITLFVVALLWATLTVVYGYRQRVALSL